MADTQAMLNLLTAAERLGWSVKAAHLDGDVCGVTDWGRRTIYIDERLPYECARSALAHELAHVRRGRPPSDPVAAEAEESCCEEQAARQLIPLELLALAMRYARNAMDVSVLLRVDISLLEARVAAMSAGEVIELHRHQQIIDRLMIYGYGVPVEPLGVVP